MITSHSFILKRSLNAVKLTELEPRSSNNVRILEGYNLNTVLDAETPIFSRTRLLNIYAHRLFELEKDHTIFFMFCKLQHNAIRLKTRFKRTSNKVGSLINNLCCFYSLFSPAPLNLVSLNPINVHLFFEGSLYFSITGGN